MFERFGTGAGAVVSAAEAEARQFGHNRIGTEHLLLGLVGTDGPASRLLRAAGATPEGCRSKVAELVGSGRSDGGAATLGLSERARRVVQRADRLSLRRRDTHIEPAHLLSSLLDVEGTAGQVLRGGSVDVAELRVAVARLLERDDPRRGSPPGIAGEDRGSGEGLGATAPTGRGPDPLCAGCGAPVDDGVAARRVESEDDRGRRQPVIVVYCPACGAVLGVVADRSSS